MIAHSRNPRIVLGMNETQQPVQNHPSITPYGVTNPNASDSSTLIWSPAPRRAPKSSPRLSTGIALLSNSATGIGGFHRQLKADPVVGDSGDLVETVDLLAGVPIAFAFGTLNGNPTAAMFTAEDVVPFLFSLDFLWIIWQRYLSPIEAECGCPRDMGTESPWMVDPSSGVSVLVEYELNGSENFLQLDLSDRHEPIVLDQRVLVEVLLRLSSMD